MINPIVRDELLSKLDRLPLELQQQVLEFAQRLIVSSMPRRAGGKDLRRFSGVLTQEDADAMIDAIESGCEQVDRNEW